MKYQGNNNDPIKFIETCDCNAPVIVTGIDGNTGEVDFIAVHTFDTVFFLYESDDYDGDDLHAVCSRCGAETSPDWQGES